MKRIGLLALLCLMPLSAQSVFINGGAVVLQNSGGNISGVQFNLTGATAAPGLPATLTSKSMNCGPGFTTCLIIGQNITAIPDGTIATLSPGATLSNLLAVSPQGVAVTLSLITNPCDVNKDGRIDVNDFALAVQIADGAAAGSADITGDGKTDIFDVFRVVLAIANGGVCKVGQ